MKTYLFLLLFVFQAFSLSSQISLKGYNQEKIDPSLFEGRWKARWISYPGEAPNVYGVYHFRKSFDLEVVPSRFIVHVSADNRYKLYVNGNWYPWARPVGISITGILKRSIWLLT